MRGVQSMALKGKNLPQLKRNAHKPTAENSMVWHQKLVTSSPQAQDIVIILNCTNVKISLGLKNMSNCFRKITSWSRQIPQHLWSDAMSVQIAETCSPLIISEMAEKDGPCKVMISIWLLDTRQICSTALSQMNPTSGRHTCDTCSTNCTLLLLPSKAALRTSLGKI